MAANALETHELRERINALESMLYELRRELASALGAEDRPRGRFRYLACRVGAVEIGVLLDHVEEVVPIALLAPLPEAPAWVTGLLNLRGESLPVVDGLARLERRSRKLELSDLVVICALEGRRFGLVVQHVFDVGQADGADIASAGDLPHAPYLLGVLEAGEHTVQMLSLARLMQLSDVPELGE